MPSEHRATRRIEFPDTDLAGIVHFSRFFVFMEAVEHEFLRSLGTSVVTEWEGNRIGWPRLSATCDYLAPARFEEVLDVRLTVVRKGTRSLTYGFSFTRDDIPIAKGTLGVVCCVCNPDEPLQTIPIPLWIADQIQEADANERD